MALRLKPVAAAVASVMVIGIAAAPPAGSQTTGSTGYGTAAESGAAARDNERSPTAGTAKRSAERDRATSAGGTASHDTAAPSTPRSSTHGANQAMADLRASRIIGLNVRNTQGQDLGEINDLVVDVTGNRIQYAVLGRGGVLGLGEKELAVPVSRFSVARDRGDLVLDMSKQQLDEAPRLQRQADWSDPRTWDDVGRYYHRTLGMPATAATATGESNARFRRASDLIGMDVVDARNDEVGEIEDLVVNLANGSIHYAVLEFDRAWNPNDKLVALPMSSLRPSGDRKDLVIGMTREQIANAPSFAPRDWPDLSDTRFRDRVSRMGRDDRTLGMDPQGRAAGAGSATASSGSASPPADTRSSSGTATGDRTDRSGTATPGSTGGSSSR